MKTRTVARSSPRRRRSALPEPPAPTFTQAEQRERRRKHLPIAYTGAFDLRREVLDVVNPLAAAVAARPNPGFYLPEVEDLADSVGALVHTVTGLLTERNAYRKVAHLAPQRRAPAVRLIVDLTERPAPSKVTEAGVASGGWAVTLARAVAPYTDDLADLLAHAWPPNAQALRGAPSVSGRVEKALRLVDDAALSLQRRLDRAETAEADRRKYQAAEAAQTDPADRARAELYELGIDLEVNDNALQMQMEDR